MRVCCQEVVATMNLQAAVVVVADVIRAYGIGFEDVGKG